MKRAASVQDKALAGVQYSSHSTRRATRGILERQQFQRIHMTCIPRLPSPEVHICWKGIKHLCLGRVHQLHRMHHLLYISNGRMVRISDTDSSHIYQKMSPQTCMTDGFFNVRLAMDAHMHFLIQLEHARLKRLLSRALELNSPCITTS